MAGEPSQAALNLTAEERRIYGQLFKEADTEGLGVITGEIALKFFQRTKLDFALLGQIWQIADTENRGFLTPPGFSIALRLIAHCQAGRTPTAELASSPAPLPKFDGAASAPAAQGARPATPTQAIAPQTTGPVRIPPLTPDKISEYQGLFERAGSRGGFLGGDAARGMFERARLPNEVLGQIWQLSDVEGRGALNLTEFIIAMHLLTCMRSGSIRALPQTLPPGLYEAASRRAPGASPPTALPRQFTGQTGRPQSPLARPPQTPPVIAAQTTGNDWLVTPQDKAKYDQIFASVDKAGLGYITGDQAVPFFSNSGLPEDTLASIWDLADIRSEGQLNRDEFAVAMYLIKEQRSKTNNRDALPATLPTKLMPPSLRQRVIPPSQPTAPAFDNAAFATTQPKSASEDLFGLDALASSPPPQAAPALQPTSMPTPVFSSPNLSQSTQSSPMTPQQTGFPQSSFKPFVPTSSFGQGISVQHTGGSVQSSSAPQGRNVPQPSAADDLLGETDPEVNNRFTNETAELGNMSNQIGTLRTQMQEVQTRKTNTDRELSTTSTQKRELESRLGAIRTQYEQEIREVKSLEERLTASRNDTKRLQQDLAMIQGSHADLTAQHNTIATQLQADQQENAALKQQLQQLNAEVAQIKPQLEKMKSDARQQKGMVAINKKQLATSEAERDKIHKEMADLEQERLERERVERERVEQERVQQEQRMRAEQERQEKLRLEHERAQKEQAEQAERTRLERERAEKEHMERQTAERSIPPPQPVSRDLGSTFTSPMASPSTNPFFRRSPEPSHGGAMAPSVFSQAFGPSHPPTDFDDFFGPNEQLTQASEQEPSMLHPQEHQREVSREDTSTPAISEPPPPPPSQQITSSALPFRSNLARSDSFGSSVRANPPASRSGMSNVGTPAQFPGSSASSLNGDSDRSPISDRFPSAGAAAPIFGQMSGSQPGNTARMTQPSAAHHIPGAFPDETRASTPTAGSTRSESFTDGSDPFSSKADQSAPAVSGGPGFSDDSPAASALDRATIEREAQPSTSGPSRAHEFPPIQELEADDSDSDEEDGFTNVAKPPTGHAPATMLNERERAVTTQHPAAQPLDNIPAPQPSVAEIGEEREAGAPPPLEAQRSPPTYEQASPTSPDGHRDTNEFPKEFTGLLPSREIASSPPQETTQHTPQSIATNMSGLSTSSRSPFGGETNGYNSREVPFQATNGFSHTASAGQPFASTSSHQAQPPVDDFDSAFDDLDEAKEEEDPQDSFVSNGGHGAEFDPVFDSPGRGAGSDFQQTPVSAQPGFTPFGNGQSSTSGPSNDFGATGASATKAGSYQPAFVPWLNNSTSSAAPASSSTSSFTPNFAGSSMGPQAPAPAQASKTNSEWDSMFSGFGNGTASKAVAGPAPPPKTSSFGFDDDEITSAPVQPPAQPPVRSSSFAKSPPPAAKPVAQRPAPVGRALTTTGEHDDPILKSLINMGFPRDEALKALERYDYNVDAAADYLTKKR